MTTNKALYQLYLEAEAIALNTTVAALKAEIAHKSADYNAGRLPR